MPTDALSGSRPPELVALESGAADVFDAAQAGDWAAAQTTVAKVTAAWKAARAQAPKRLGPQLSGALERLAAGVVDRNAPQARQAAIDVAGWSLDLQLRHRPVVEIDLARFDLWLAQVQVDAAAGDAAAVNGDFFTLDYVRDRIQHQLDAADRSRLNAELEELSGAIADEELAAAAEAAGQLRKTVALLR